MYIESKAGGLTGPARIGRVTFSKSGRTLYYCSQEFASLKGGGFKANYYDVATGEEYWISGPKKDGSDRLYGERTPQGGRRRSRGRHCGPRRAWAPPTEGGGHQLGGPLAGAASTAARP